MEAALSLAKGDMRKALNLLQCTWMAYGNITGDTVYSCAGHPLRSEIEAGVSAMLTKPIKAAVQEVDDMRSLKSYAAQEVLEDVHLYLADCTWYLAPYYCETICLHKLFLPRIIIMTISNCDVGGTRFC